jgi:hypothetical protein
MDRRVANLDHLCMRSYAVGKKIPLSSPFSQVLIPISSKDFYWCFSKILLVLFKNT